QQTSLVICDETSPDQGRGYLAREMGVPLVGDADFMSLLEHVVGGTELEEFTDATLTGDQFTLF
ncbi:MAG: polymerase subunit epsilon, partial [Mycobacterium sp.]|nr:polymerase subunit epsilon [Mycobacterium sp.]